VSIALIEAFERAGKPIGFVCHAPGALRHVKAVNGEPLIKGRRVTGFSNSEEAAVQLTEVVPFLIEDEFKNWAASMRRALTGNPSSSSMACW